jgi:hypothetical protein
MYDKLVLMSSFDIVLEQLCQGGFHPQRVLLRPGAVGPPADLATAFGGGTGRIFHCQDEKCLLSGSKTASGSY